MDGCQRNLGLRCFLGLVLVSCVFAGCSSDPTLDTGATAGGGDDFSQLDAGPGDDSAPAKKAEDAFSDFDSDKAASGKNEDERLDQEVSQATPPEDKSHTPEKPSSDNLAQKSPPAVVDQPPADTDDNFGAPAPPVVADAEPSKPEPPPSASAASNTPEPPVAAAADSGSLVIIQNMGIRSNPGAEPALEVRATGPIEYQDNSNADLNQTIIDIPHSKLGPKMKLPLNMRDFSSPIASVTAYKLDATTSRIVVQMRSGATAPTIETNGSLLLVKTEAPAPAPAVAAAPAPTRHSIMDSNSLEDFLSNNQKFYGKEISLETTDDLELKDIFKLISDEANVNLIVTDDVKGKMSVKLKNTPWDQALVIIMKAKKLGYSRSGNILRIAPVADLKKEEEDSLALMTAKRTNGTLIAKSIQVNYSKIDDLEKQVKSVLSPRGSVVSDARTSALIVTDIQENLERAIQLVQVLDIAPQQVLIEGKVVEADETFERDIGFHWNLSGRTTQLTGAKSSSGPIRLNQSIDVSPGAVANPSLGLNFDIGTFDVIGDLTAALALYESKGMAKVLSSPRIVALHNEKSEIDQDMQIPIVTSSVAAAGATAVPTVTFKDVRLKLEVTPLVTNEGTVIMDVSVMREFLGSVPDQLSKIRPINSRSAKTKVMVRNGQTAVIGGIYENNSSDSEVRVPGLASLPLVGWLFKNKTKTNDHEELMIFLTPKILASAQAGAAETTKSASSSDSPNSDF